MRIPSLTLSGILLLSALFGSYAAWTLQRPAAHYLSDLRSRLDFSRGQASGRGNLVGIQPELFPADYQSVGRLRLKLAAYLDKARDEGLLNDKTVVVLPEHIGTWLVATGEKDQLYRARTLGEAMAWLALGNPLSTLTALVRAEGEDRLGDALLRMKAERMAADYQALFGGLARAYGVTLVAGSIVLPEPRVERATLRVGDGPLYNVSLVFARDGQPLGQPQRKVLPVGGERRVTGSARRDALGVVDTPAGRLGVLFYADSDDLASHAELARHGAQLLAVPAFLSAHREDQAYRLAALPAPLQPNACTATATPVFASPAARLRASGAEAGIAVFMRGRLWDLGSAGRSLVLGQDGTQLAEDGRGARLINLWL
ncbi:carbon-nitrogen hydrolase family protein [Pseudomonas sp. RIT-PI-AD]|uniref:carbon-nitrogen hydrolase family protein n=1 Tax=Pseudomonas sp. RIT-PI-AD TaxID=3035294 RepID=UPI0021D8B580|nr:carbon-nitrogen hydrolase family protein [Pseudomonas sp. RIT-PI-AD]